MKVKSTSALKTKSKPGASSLWTEVSAQITLLGTGTSSGVPLIGCTCTVCRSQNLKNKRLRVSAWVQIWDTKKNLLRSLVIDTSTDFRQQALRAKIPKVDAVLYTHPHSDHVSGIDDLRAYNFIQKDIIPVYGNLWTQSDLLSRFEYVFSHRPSEGGGLPKLSFHLIEKSLVPIEVADFQVIPIALPHGKDQVLAYRLGDVAYVTDVHELGSEAIQALQGVQVLILDCVRVAPHRTHLNLERALFYASEIKARQTVLTHLGHEFDHVRTPKQLPKGVVLGFDGQKIRFNAKMKTGWLNKLER